MGENSFYHPYLQTLPGWEELEGGGMPVFGLLREMEEGAGEGGADAGAEDAKSKMRGSEGGVLRERFFWEVVSDFSLFFRIVDV